MVRLCLLPHAPASPIFEFSCDVFSVAPQGVFENSLIFVLLSFFVEVLKEASICTSFLGPSACTFFLHTMYSISDIKCFLECSQTRGTKVSPTAKRGQEG